MNSPRADTLPSGNAIRYLGRAAREPFPAQEINSGMVGKLVALGYVELVDKPSPYRSHRRGHKVAFLVATAAGRDFLANGETR